MRARRLAVCVLMLSAMLTVPAAADGVIERTLMDGGLVRIDPETGKARVVTPRGAEAMLWDGVHKLRDGSTIIVRDGVVVPDKPIIGARRRVPEPLTGEPCAELERKVCGPAGECADTRACRLARDLVEFERQDREAGRLDAVGRTLAQCRQALEEDETFPPCAGSAPRGLPSPECSELYERVCGPAEQCGDTPACRAARQLVELERDEARDTSDPGAELRTTRQCREAASDGFFAPCRDGAGPKDPASGS